MTRKRRQPVSTRRRANNRNRTLRLRDLFRITAGAHALRAGQEHPQLITMRAGDVMQGKGVTLFPSEQASRDNEAYLARHPNHILPYHQQSVTLEYSSNKQTGTMVRVLGKNSNAGGAWATRMADVQADRGRKVLSGREIQRKLALPSTPTSLVVVVPAPGTRIRVSRPITGDAWQYEILDQGKGRQIFPKAQLRRSARSRLKHD